MGDTRGVSLLGARPVHPGRGEPSRIELSVILDYIKGSPVANIVLSRREAIRLIEDLATSIRITEPSDV